MEIQSYEPFYVLVSNFGRTSIQLPKRMHISTATDPPETIVHIEPGNEGCKVNKERSAEPDAVTTVHYKPMESRETQMQRHKAVETEDKEQQMKYWKDKVDIGPSYEHLRPQILNMLSEFTHMWVAHLGTIRTVRHRIDLDPPTAKPVHSAPYRAGPTARRL